jgi:hypothetical protein
MSAIGKGIPIIASRRALERLSSKYPHHLSQIIKEKPKKDDTPWPVYMKRAGYTAISLAVPYTLSVIISESPRLRDYLEGEPGTDNSFSFGRKIVEFVRWYWGRQDDIPYSEYVHNQHHSELSLPIGDLSFMKRREQQMIQDRLSSEVVICVKTNNDQSATCQPVQGRLNVSDAPSVFQISNLMSNGSPTSLSVTFQDDDDNKENVQLNALDTFSPSINGDEEPAPAVMKTASDVANLTTIWSAWYHFPKSSQSSKVSNTSGSLNETRSISTNKRQIDNYQPFIDELSREIELLQADLRDPQCIKDRDEMESRIMVLKKEIQSLRRERRLKKLKHIFSW